MIVSRGIILIVRNISNESHVYRTVHHLDSWIKRDQLDVTCFFISLFNAQHVSDVNTSILRSLRLICWVIPWVVLLWYDVCWCYGVVWLGWCGIRMQAEALHWTVHHFDSWIKRDQLDVTWFFILLFNDQHVSDVNTSILRSLRLICWIISWVILLWHDVCWCYGVVWLGWCVCVLYVRSLSCCVASAV
jgi:hypothetical protein